MSDVVAGDELSDARRLAGSADWADRQRAGIVLAGFLDEPEVAGDLRSLLLDPQNTAVPCATAEALLARLDTEATRLVLEAYRDGEEEWSFHIAIQFARYRSDARMDACLASLSADDQLASAIADLRDQVGWD